MTSRERVLTAIRHEHPDQVPVDMGATPSSGISAIAYSNQIMSDKWTYNILIIPPLTDFIQTVE